MLRCIYSWKQMVKLDKNSPERDSTSQNTTFPRAVHFLTGKPHANATLKFKTWTVRLEYKLHFGLSLWQS